MSRPKHDPEFRNGENSRTQLSSDSRARDTTLSSPIVPRSLRPHLLRRHREVRAACSIGAYLSSLYLKLNKNTTQRQMFRLKLALQILALAAVLVTVTSDSGLGFGSECSVRGPLYGENYSVCYCSALYRPDIKIDIPLAIHLRVSRASRALHLCVTPPLFFCCFAVPS